MEENIFSEDLTGKLYTRDAIRVATFLGGPLAAGFMIADNYRHLGEHKKVQTTWLIAVPVTIAIFVLAFILPDNFPPIALPLAYTMGVYFLVENLQGKKIKAHTAQGGQTWPMGRAVVIGLIGLLIILAIVFGSFMLMDQFIG
jgi:hypothetical protein